MTDVTTHPTYRHLLAAVKAVPDDDLPRLVLADWLEEHGEPDRAEFIRVQCELSRPYDVHADTYWRGQLDMPPDVAHRVKLRQRERELRPKGDRLYYGTGPYDYITDWDYVRGFPGLVRGPLAALVGERCDVMACNGTGRNSELGQRCDNCHGTGHIPGVLRRVVAEHPVTAVEVTNVAPRENEDAVSDAVDAVGEPGEWYFRSWSDSRGGWGVDEHRDHNVPPEVFDLMLSAQGAKQYPGDLHLVFFPTRELATAALSTAMIAWAATPEEHADE